MKDCRRCEQWETCPSGKAGHRNGASIGYSIGACQDYKEKKVVYYDYSVTWNQVKNLVDKMFENPEEKVAMGDIKRAVKRAWDILYDDMARKYGDEV